MRSCAAFVAMLMLTIGVSACGKYGPPERSVVTQERIPVPWATEPRPQLPDGSQAPEEKVREPSDFEDDDPWEEEPWEEERP